MLIDWFTVAAQALNFVILVALMRRFLYKPILDAVDAREKRIATELADADAKKAEAKKERDDFQHKNEELDAQRTALLAKAAADATAEGQRLVNEARKAGDALAAKRQNALTSEAHNLSAALHRRVEQEVFSIARKALADLATANLEACMVEVFCRRLRQLEAPAKALLGEALKASSEAAVVRTAFELPSEQHAAIQNALNETFSADVRLRFETSPDLVSGIALVTNGQMVGWSIDGYLASLEKSVGDLLREHEKAKGPAKADDPHPPSAPPAPVAPPAPPAPDASQPAQPSAAGAVA